MNYSQLYEEFWKRKINGTNPRQNSQTAINNNDYSGYSEQNDRNIWQQAFNDYMQNVNNSQNNNAEKIKNSQNTGASITETGGNIAKGFMQGGMIGGIIEAIKAGRKASKNARNNAMELGKVSMENDAQNNQTLINEADAQLANNQQQLSDIVNSSQIQGAMTGGAAPIVDNLLTQYQDYLRQNGYDENTVNGVAQGLNNGYKEIADWQNQYAQSKDGQNAGYRIPQTEEEIALAKLGNFNVANPLQTGKVSATGKKSWLNNLANGLSDLSKGYNENKNTPFSPDNLRPDDNKNKMTRTGEALGTIARIAQTPAGQGAIAGGLSTVLTGNPLYGLGNAYKFANQRQMSDIYNQVLKEQGIDIPVGTYGNLKANDINAVMTPQYKDVLNNIALAKLEELKNYHDTMAELKRKSNENLKNYRESNIKIKQQNADTQAYKAKNGTIVKHISKGGGKNEKNNLEKKDNEGYVLMQSPDNRIFKVPESQIERYKKAGGKIVG